MYLGVLRYELKTLLLLLYTRERVFVVRATMRVCALCNI